MGPNIIRLRKTESFFIGRELNDQTIRTAGEIARGEIAPISDVRGSADFRLQLGENILRKFLAELSNGGNGTPDRHDGNGNGGPERRGHFSDSASSRLATDTTD